MNDFGQIFSNQLGAIQKEVQTKERMAQTPNQGANDVKVFIAKWDEFVRLFVHQAGVRSEEELKKITLYDFMNWLRGQNV